MVVTPSNDGCTYGGRKSEQIFFAQPKVHQNKFANLNKMVPTDPLKMIAFFE
jgi:hypothetical protein